MSDKGVDVECVCERLNGVHEIKKQAQDQEPCYQQRHARFLAQKIHGGINVSPHGKGIVAEVDAE